jgi:hypothetical protein
MPLFYIDFSTWVLEAPYDEEAIIKAVELLKNGPPSIAGVSDAEERDCEFLEYEFTNQVPPNRF